MSPKNLRKYLFVQQLSNFFVQLQRLLDPKERHGQRTQLRHQWHILHGRHFQAELQAIMHGEHCAGKLYKSMDITLAFTWVKQSFLLPARRSICWHVSQLWAWVLQLQPITFGPHDKSAARRPLKVCRCSVPDPWCHQPDNRRDSPCSSSANPVPSGKIFTVTVSF